MTSQLLKSSVHGGLALSKMRLFRAVGRLIEPHVRWLFTKQWSLINSVKALPQKCRVRFEMGMSDKGRIESFQELSFGEIRCRILIRSIFVRMIMVMQ